MRLLRAYFVLYALILVVIIATAAGLWLLSAPAGGCPPLPSDADAGQLRTLLQTMPTLPSGQSFDLAGSPTAWAAALAAQEKDDLHPSALAGLRLDAGDGSLHIDLCLRGLLLIPTRLRATLKITASSGALRVEAREIILGRLRLPEPALRAVNAWLNSSWRQFGWAWQIDQVDVSQALLRVRGRRR